MLDTTARRVLTRSALLLATLTAAACANPTGPADMKAPTTTPANANGVIVGSSSGVIVGSSSGVIVGSSS